MPDTAVPPHDSAAPFSTRSRFTCRQSAGEQVKFLALTGELDIATVPELDAALRGATATPFVILDLRELEFLDSSGAQLILAADRRIRGANGRLLVLVEPGGEIEWLLALTGADRQLHLAGPDAPLALTARAA
jgi:anti-sigma B factor antagonist